MFHTVSLTLTSTVSSCTGRWWVESFLVYECISIFKFLDINVLNVIFLLVLYQLNIRQPAEKVALSSPCLISSLLCGLSEVQPLLLQLFCLHLHPPSYIFPLKMAFWWHPCTVDPLRHSFVIQFNGSHVGDMTDGSLPHEPLMLIRLKWLNSVPISMKQQLIVTNVVDSEQLFFVSQCVVDLQCFKIFPEEPKVPQSLGVCSPRLRLCNMLEISVLKIGTDEEDYGCIASWRQGFVLFSFASLMLTGWTK